MWTGPAFIKHLFKGHLLGGPLAHTTLGFIFKRLRYIDRELKMYINVYY